MNASLPLPIYQTKPTFIYGLRERFDCRIRYIGKTERLKERLHNHCNEKSRCHRTNWIQSVLKRGGTIEMVLLCKVPFWAKWQDSERAWISHALLSGWPLTNSTDGGDGVSGLSGESKERMAKTWIGRHHTEEAKRKIAEKIKGRKHTEEYKAYMRRIMSVRVFTPEHRRKLSQSAKRQVKKRKFSPEMLESIRQRLQNGEKQKDLAIEFGVNKRTMWLIKSGRIYNGY